MDAVLSPSGPILPARGEAAFRPGDPQPDPALDRAARAFEAAFIAEMLKHSGVGKTPESFGGGVGEEQFASLLQEAQAREMAQAGGIGLAEYIVAALQEGQNAE